MKILSERLRTPTQSVAIPLDNGLWGGRRRTRMRMDARALKEDDDETAREAKN